MDEASFERIALDVFALQFAACAPYRALCERAGRTPETVTHWTDVPLVPATAFKYFDFASVDADPDAVFRTSGTTRGAGRRGRHVVPDLELYRAASVPVFRAALLPDVDRLPFVSLIPEPRDAPDSSLSCMVGLAAGALSTRTLWLVDGDGAWRPGAVEEADDLVAAGQPVLVLGTALALQHVLESDDGPLGPLPEGSRLMETGGFKGARRTVSRTELHDGLRARFRLPEGRIVNEYGMTELLSQLYEPVLSEGSAGAGWHVPAPWLRVRVLDPVSLAELPEGETGVLAFFDLANAGSVAHVLTEDLGHVRDGRLRLVGRALDAEPRGCSRAMDELMSANRADP